MPGSGRHYPHAYGRVHNRSFHKQPLCPWKLLAKLPACLRSPTEAIRKH